MPEGHEVLYHRFKEMQRLVNLFQLLFLLFQTHRLILPNGAMVKKNRPMCKDDPSVCNPNARGVQLGAFAGLDPNGDLRTGMSRGGNGAPGTVS